MIAGHRDVPGTIVHLEATPSIAVRGQQRRSDEDPQAAAARRNLGVGIQVPRDRAGPSIDSVKIAEAYSTCAPLCDASIEIEGHEAVAPQHVTDSVEARHAALYGVDRAAEVAP